MVVVWFLDGSEFWGGRFGLMRCGEPARPFAKYDEIGRDYFNLGMPPWQLVRASTAAPTYSPPEVITLQAREPNRMNQKELVFVDGGVTIDPAELGQALTG